MDQTGFEKILDFIEDNKEKMSDDDYMKMMNTLKNIFDANKENQVADLKAEVADLKAEVADLKAEVADLKEQIDAESETVDVTHEAYMETLTQIMKLVPIEKKEVVAKIDCHGFGLAELM